ncbi:MAG TPA: EamA family transporter [Anaerolineae bacterium]|nr:EamA family transporter [Anaerolineae bacterium]
MISQVGKSRWQPYLVLAIGALAVSWAAVLIRVAAAPALVTGAYRLTLASLILTPLALWRNHDQLLHLGWRDVRLLVGAGLFLGLHFATWINSLSYTSVSSSVVLVSTSPIFVELTARFFLNESVSARMFAGIALAVLGTAIVGWGGLTLSSSAL